MNTDGWVVDTITAVSTPTGQGGIAIVRLSGPDAITISDRVLKLTNPLKDSPSHTLQHGYLIGDDGSIIDEVIASFMKAPRSYTREDTVEINCHAGAVAAALALEAVLSAGARLAEPGEFTRRAFLNGRIDLTQAEAVAGIIKARTVEAHRVAQAQLSGNLTRELEVVSGLLLEAAARLEAGLDFAEDGVELLDVKELVPGLETAAAALKNLLDTERHGEILEDGALVAIVGKPNVGKSSLLNALLGRPRAIVDPAAGTTRDTVEGDFAVSGIPVTLIDTAGVRAARDTVEAEGVKRSLGAIEEADLVLWVFDGSVSVGVDDMRVLQAVPANTPRLAVANKSDLGRAVYKKESSPLFNCQPLHVSALTGEGLNELKAAIAGQLQGGSVIQPGRAILATARQRVGVRQATELVREATTIIMQGAGEEIVSELIREALEKVGELTGKGYSEDLLDKIFSTFCIGK